MSNHREQSAQPQIAYPIATVAGISNNNEPPMQTNAPGVVFVMAPLDVGPM